jgi:hypothetical protein
MVNNQHKNFSTLDQMNIIKILHMLYHAANEPDILQEAEKRQNRI